MTRQSGAPMGLETIRGRHSRNVSPLLATVSGIASSTASMIDWFARETCVHIITTKSIELRPNPGYREPVITQPRAGCFGNAVGLRNPGVEQAFGELAALRRSWQDDPPGETPLLNVSLSGSSAEDFALLARRLSPVADMLELNFSCPHAAAGYGAAIGSDESAIRSIIRAVKNAVDIPVFVKLTPNVEDIAGMAFAAVEAGADGVVAINTVGPALYTEPDSGMPILNNSPTGKGGMSGLWIYERALAAVSSIRRELGHAVPVIGMGGVSSSERVAEMHRAGADVVGIGSALGTMHQRDWPAFFSALTASDTGSPRVGPALHEGSISIEQAPTSYRRCTVREVDLLEPTIVEITLNESMSVAPGQTVFVWIPDLGEKPFAVAICEPITLVVKIKGPFTRQLARLEPSDRIYLRGPYGDPHDPPRGTEEVLMVVAGTGIAAVSLLVHKLVEASMRVKMFLGLRDSACRTPLAGDPIVRSVTEVVYDHGTEGAVLTVFASALKLRRGGVGRRAVYTVGPDRFVNRALGFARQAGVEAASTFVSLERMMMCGLGLCGACSCGGELTCQYGTFVTAEALRREKFRDQDHQGGEKYG